MSAPVEDAERPTDMALVEKRGPVAVLTLNFPRRRNALCRQMRLQLKERLEELNGSSAVRAIVIRGEGGHFCAGGDITEMRKRTLPEARHSFELVHTLFRLLAGGPKPIVAAVDGVAMGAGLSIVSLADYVVATPQARLGTSFVRMGLMPDVGGLWGLSQKLGLAKARELIGLARQFDGRQALDLGLANELAEPQHVEDRALAVAGEYSALPPLANAFVRAAFAQGCTSVEQTIRLEQDLGTVLSCSEDHTEAAAAFLEKRIPKFTGR